MTTECERSACHVANLRGKIKRAEGQMGDEDDFKQEPMFPPYSELVYLGKFTNRERKVFERLQLVFFKSPPLSPCKDVRYLGLRGSLCQLETTSNALALTHQSQNEFPK